MPQVETIVIGAGQAGLATGYHLAQGAGPFVILESHARVGDEWRNRWDSLRLFTPGRFSGLPGMANPVGRDGFATQNEFADYLEAYARWAALPIQLGVRVTGVECLDGGFTVNTTEGAMTARQVVVASGPNRVPSVPPFAGEVNARQLHSSEYRNPRDVAQGNVLVVGAGPSGAEIALELSATHNVAIAGRPTPHVPDAVFRFAGTAYWRVVNSVLTTDTRPGRKVAGKFHDRGAPLIRVSMSQLKRAGVRHLPRITGVSGGQPVAGEVGAVPCATVIWATGYRPDLSWLPPVPTDDSGFPVTQRGVVEGMPGLYFVGMPFQYALTSGLVGGVGRDAEFIAARVETDSQRSPLRTH